MSGNGAAYRQAASMIEQGWVQGTNSNGDGCVCAYEALRRATGQQELSEQMLVQVDAELSQSLWYRFWRLFHSGNIRWAIWEWNDVHWRRKRTVVNLFRRLADKQEVLDGLDFEPAVELAC